jgi:hypothetical protein
MWATWALHAQWADALFVLIAIAFLVSPDRKAVSIGALDVAVLGYLAAIAISLPRAPSPRAGAAEWLKTAYLACVYVVVATLVRDQPDRRHLAGWLATVATALAVVGVIVFAGQLAGIVPDGLLGAELQIPYVGAVRRLSLGFFTPEMLGDFLTTAAPFVLAMLLKPMKLPPAAIAALIGALLLVEALTFSHSWVGFLVACLVACWNQWLAGAWRLARAAIAAAAFALFIASNLASIVYVRPVHVELRPVAAPDGDIPVHVNQRGDWHQANLTVTFKDMHYFALKAIAWNAFRLHPLTGLGLGNFGEATEQAYVDGRLESVCRACQPHSTYFGQLAETGLVGTAALALLFGTAITVGSRTLRHEPDGTTAWITRSSVAGIAGLLVNGINADIMHFRFLWIVLAMLRASTR